MRSLGGLLFFFGLGSVVLNLFNYQFAILAPIEEYQPWAGIVLAVVGAVLVGIGAQQEQAARKRSGAEMAAVTAPAPAMAGAIPDAMGGPLADAAMPPASTGAPEATATERDDR